MNLTLTPREVSIIGNSLFLLNEQQPDKKIIKLILLLIQEDFDVEVEDIQFFKTALLVRLELAREMIVSPKLIDPGFKKALDSINAEIAEMNGLWEKLNNLIAK